MTYQHVFVCGGCRFCEESCIILKTSEHENIKDMKKKCLFESSIKVEWIHNVKEVVE